MAGFMPSEIARLVLGYLKEKKCLDTYNTFLSENPVLQEYKELLDRGKEYPTTFAGKSLMTILDEYYKLTVKGNESSSDKNSEEVEPSAAPNKTVRKSQQSGVFLRQRRINPRTVITPVHSTHSPVQYRRSYSHGMSPNNLFSSPCFTPPKSRVRTMLEFETPEKSNSGTSKHHCCDPPKQKSLSFNSASEHDVTGGNQPSGSSAQKNAVISAAVAHTASSMYINSSVQTNESFISAKSDSNHKSPFVSPSLPNATCLPLHCSQDNQTVVNSSGTSFSPGASKSPSQTLALCDENKLPDGNSNHHNGDTEKLTESKDCTKSDELPATSTDEQGTLAVIPSLSAAFVMTPDYNQELQQPTLLLLIYLLRGLLYHRLQIQ